MIMHMNGDHTGRALPGVIAAVRARGLHLHALPRLPEWVSALPGHLSPSEVHDLAGELRSKLPAERSPGNASARHGVPRLRKPLCSS